jgi:hypothetical protein
MLAGLRLQQRLCLRDAIAGDEADDVRKRKARAQVDDPLAFDDAIANVSPSR